jgi:hypothetical protein
MEFLIVIMLIALTLVLSYAILANSKVNAVTMTFVLLGVIVPMLLMFILTILKTIA